MRVRCIKIGLYIFFMWTGNHEKDRVSDQKMSVVLFYTEIKTSPLILCYLIILIY